MDEAVEQEITNKIMAYARKNGRFPKWVSVGMNLVGSVLRSVHSQPSLDLSRNQTLFRGMPIHFVHRENYIEAMPRRKPRRKGMIYYEPEKFFSPMV